MREMKGIYPATVTAFDADGALDTEAMRRIVCHQLDAGVHGLYICGGTGEGLLLTVEERLRAIETVVDEVSGRAGVIAHIGAFRIDETIAVARRAGDLGVDAVAALPPSYFYVPDTAGLIEHYTELAAAATAPLLIYNLPQRTGVTMTKELFDPLMQLDNVIGMKDSSGNVKELGSFMTDHPDAVIFNGEDTGLGAGLLAGACGGIGATYNVMPDLYVQLWGAVQTGDMETLERTHARMHQIWKACLSVDLFGGVKQTLAWMGLPCGAPRRPLRPLTADDTALLRRNLEAIDFFA